jgi:hypothetical protein
MANRSWKEGKIIEAWKLAKVVMIEKKATDRNNPRNYRPISLTNSIIKIIQKLQKRLNFKLNINSYISPYQSGFQKTVLHSLNLASRNNFNTRPTNDRAKNACRAVNRVVTSVFSPITSSSNSKSSSRVISPIRKTPSFHFLNEMATHGDEAARLIEQQRENDAQLAAQQQAQLVTEDGVATNNPTNMQNNLLTEMLRLLQLQSGQLNEMTTRIQRLEAEANQRNEAMRQQQVGADGHQPHGNFNHQLAVGDRMELEYGEMRVELSVCSNLITNASPEQNPRVNARTRTKAFEAIQMHDSLDEDALQNQGFRQGLASRPNLQITQTQSPIQTQTQAQIHCQSRQPPLTNSTSIDSTDV